MSRTFQTQGEAETWLGEFYPSLLQCRRPGGEPL